MCADHNGFSLHAKVHVPAGELERLEHLCRYIARSPIATQRLALAPNGRDLGQGALHIRSILRDADAERPLDNSDWVRLDS